MNKILGYMALGKPIVQFDFTEGMLLASTSVVVCGPKRHRGFCRETARLARQLPTMRNHGRAEHARVATSLRLLEAYAAEMKSSPARKVTSEP
jgi:hypothetical protein